MAALQKYITVLLFVKLRATAELVFFFIYSRKSLTALIDLQLFHRTCDVKTHAYRQQNSAAILRVSLQLKCTD